MKKTLHQRIFKKHRFKEGDKILVYNHFLIKYLYNSYSNITQIRKNYIFNNLWHDTWVTNMNMFLNKECIISEIGRNTNNNEVSIAVKLIIENCTYEYYFPSFCLKKI